MNIKCAALATACIFSHGTATAEQVSNEQWKSHKTEIDTCIAIKKSESRLKCLTGAAQKTSEMIERATATPPKTAEQLQAEEREAKYQAFIAAAKTTLSADFKDPTSVMWRGLFVSGENLLFLCGEVNGKNSYGAYIGYRRFISTATSSPLNMVETKKDAYVFEEMWRTSCSNRNYDVKS